MRILAVADIESKYFYDYYKEDKLKEIDLILACGDLEVEYLEFLVTMANCPLVYVYGNHDENHKKVPEGCICAENRVVECKGLRIAGLGGSHKYRDGKYMYTEGQMKRRMFRLNMSIKKHKGVDIFISHAPARHLNDFDTMSHMGFECFNTLLDTYKPKLFIHGHIHRNYGNKIPQKTEHNGTTVVNAYEYCIIEI